MLTNYVKIRGTEAELLGLVDIDDLVVRARSARDLGTGTWEVFGYATEAVIAEIQTRGLSVEIVVSQTDRQSHLAGIDSAIGDDSEDTDFA